MRHLDSPALDEIGYSLADRDMGIVTVNGAIHLYASPTGKKQFFKKEYNNSGE